MNRSFDCVPILIGTTLRMTDTFSGIRKRRLSTDRRLFYINPERGKKD